MTNPGGCRLVLLPGLGADGRMFEPQRRAGIAVETPTLPEPTADEPIGAYAARVARQIDTGEPFYLGGVSFGGMLAQEVARHVRPRALLLISTCSSSAAVSPWVRWTGAPIRWLPPRPFKLAASAVLVPALVCERVPWAQRRLLFEMWRATPAGYFKWATRAVLGWECAGPLGVPIHHIHGDGDRLLRPSYVRADMWVEGGGHMISMTHADEVNRFLRERMGE